MDVVRRRGIAGLTHRAVAEQAGVPLGSTTYHYANRGELLAVAMRAAISEHEAFIAEWSQGLDATNVASRLASLLAAGSRPEAHSRSVVEYELYLAAVRTVELRPLSRQWDAVLRDVLVDRLGVRAGRLHFAAYNGLMLEALITAEPLDETEVEEVLTAIAVSLH